MKLSNLLRIANYAKSQGCTTANIYKYKHKYNLIEIDGIYFIDKTKAKK